MDTSQNRLLTVGQVAEIFGIDPKTVTRWRRGGRLPGVLMPSGRYHYYESEIRALIRPPGEPESVRKAYDRQQAQGAP